VAKAMAMAVAVHVATGTTTAALTTVQKMTRLDRELINALENLAPET